MSRAHDVVQLVKKTLDSESVTFLIGKERRYGIAASVGALALNFEWRIAICALVVGINGESTSSAIGCESNGILADAPRSAISAGRGEPLGATLRNDAGAGFTNALGSSLIVNDMR